MPIYEYQGQQYEMQETDPYKAKARILSYLGTQQAPAPQEKRDTTLAEDFQIGLGNAGATAVRGAGLIAVKSHPVHFNFLSIKLIAFSRLRLVQLL